MANTAEQIKLESISPLYYFDVDRWNKVNLTEMGELYIEATDKNMCL